MPAMSAVAVSAFRPEALDANRAGRLTDAQATDLRARASSTRKELIVLGTGFAVIGVVLLTAAGPAAGTAVRLVGGIGGLIVGAALAYVGSPLGSALTRELRDPRVETVEGAVLRDRRVTNTSGSTLHTYTVTVAHRTYKVDRALFDATPEGGHVRLYVLPRSHTIVNLERLADQPLPPGMIGSPEALEDIGHEMRSGDTDRQAEGLAQLAALYHELRPETHKGVHAPPAEARDPRPLAESILGAWETGHRTFAFAAGGDLTVTAPSGRTAGGAWSVDGSGQLRFRIGDNPESLMQAWVADGTLSIVDRGETLVLHRVAES
jgi:hypothetical protein